MGVALIGLLAGAYHFRNSGSFGGIASVIYNSSDGSAAVTADQASVTEGQVTTATRQADSIKTIMDKKATLKTNFGDIVIELFEKDAPKTVANFLKLSKEGFYDNTKFHRVIPGFMVQGGDPNSKDTDWSNDGMGGPGYKFADELDPSTDSYKSGYVRGTLAMANSGPNTNGSQFFIMHKDYPLPNAYTIFGKVLSGLEVVDIIANLSRNSNDHPTTDAVISSVKVE